MCFCRIILLLHIAVGSPVRIQPWSDNFAGTCNCIVNISNQEVYHTNNCTQFFMPSIEVLVMPMHPGTGDPRVKTDCICTCQLDFRN